MPKHDHPVPSAAMDYLDRCRGAEQDFLLASRRAALEAAQISAAAVPAWRAFLTLHTKQLFWTIRHAVGFDRLRRRQRRSRPRRGRPRHLIPVPSAAPQQAPRVFVDVSYAATSRLATGIQRVVRECAREAHATGAGCPVVIEDGRMIAAYGSRRKELPVAPGDTLLLLDSCWDRLEGQIALLREAKARRGRIVACIYDLIPLQFPTACAAPLVDAFALWVRMVLPLCDAIVTISAAVATDIRRLTLAPDLPIAVFPLACGLAKPAAESVWSETLAAFKSERTFLSVGTIEPRKGYPIALDAFETLWSRGSDAAYVLLGRTGWSMSHFERRILTHPEYGKRLFWLQNAGDADLAYAYRHARALISPSIAEGFGLPIIEAAHAGLPVILSDIAVFREIGTYADAGYFAVADATDLARHIATRLDRSPDAPAPKMRSIPSWRDATATVLAMVRSPDLYTAGGRILTAEDFGLA